MGMKKVRKPITFFSWMKVAQLPVYAEDAKGVG